MKRIILILGIVSCLLMAQTSFAASRQRPIRLKMASMYMNKHPVYQFAFKQWIEEIKKRTNDRVLITYYNPGTIVPPAEILDATLKGQIDIGGTYLARNPGRFPLATVTNKIPVTTSTVLAASMAFWELWKTTPAIQAEFKGLKILGLHQSAAMQLVTKDKRVSKVKDIEGLRLIVVTKSGVTIAKALGASTVFQPPREVYLALSRNMGEGVIFTVPLMRSLKVNEATKYMTLFDFNSGPMWLAMNQAKWDSLPPDIQKVFEETTGEVMTQAIGKALDKGEEEDTTVMKKQGMEFIVPTAQEKAQAASILTPVLKKAFLDEAASAKSTYADLGGLYEKAQEIMKKCETMYGRK